MEKETQRILNIIKKEDGYHCGCCKPCEKIEESLNRIIKKLKEETKKDDN